MNFWRDMEDWLYSSGGVTDLDGGLRSQTALRVTTALNGWTVI